MRKQFLVSICLAASALCVACGNKTADTQTKARSSAKVSLTAEERATFPEEKTVKATPAAREYAYEITSSSDYNKLAMNLSQLVSDSDLIVKIRVKDVKPYISEDGMIQTEIIPEIVKTYKGNYAGQDLFVNGGEMLYSEYMKNETVQKMLSGHGDPSGDNSEKYVKQTVDNQYTISPEEEYIFFAKQRPDSGKYFSTYAYQGTFRIENGTVQNQAITGEPLFSDIEKKMQVSNRNLKSSNALNGTDSMNVAAFEGLLLNTI